MSEEACCSHSRVFRIVTHHKVGTCSDSWECADCKAKFVVADAVAPLVDAAKRLVDKLNAIHNDEHYKDVWFCYANHGGDYSKGPKYDKELAALTAALAGVTTEGNKHIWGEDEHCERCGLHLTEVESRKFCKATEDIPRALATIEKSYKQGVDDMDRNWREREKLDAAAQPQPKEQQEIAKKWALEMPGVGKEFYAQLESIILAAITEAREQWLIEGKEQLASGAVAPAAQPQRSEQPQEQWTPEIVAEILSGAFDESDEHGRGLKAIADAHNAVVAAERQRRKQAEVAHERAEQREELLSNQLLSAQVAIDEHNKSYCSLSRPIKPDLCLLHQHDAEVRKPLVEVLRDASCRLRELTRCYEERWGKDHTKDFHDLINRIDALAKVKERQ